MSSPMKNRSLDYDCPGVNLLQKLPSDSESALRLENMRKDYVLNYTVV